MSYTYEYPRPAVTTDVLLITRQKPHKVLLIQRGGEPFKDQWAIPGGFVDMDEDIPDAARRELEEETGINGLQIEQFRTYGGVNRDPRHRTISVVYYAWVEDELPAVGMDDAKAAAWFDIDQLPELAFDHSQIVNDVREELI